MEGRKTRPDPDGVKRPARSLSLVSLGLMATLFNLGVSAQLVEQDYPSPQIVRGLGDPTIAFGLFEAEDWTAQLPFLNLMKSARAWIGHLPGRYGGWTESDLRARGYLDADGWPTTIPGELESIGTVWGWAGKGFEFSSTVAGRYIARYSGDGTIQIQGASNITQTAGEVSFTYSGTGNLQLVIVETDPNGTGNYIRDIEVVKESNLDLYDAGAIFNPDWLTLIEDARQIRFMDWGDTNGSDERYWNERKSESYYRWGGDRSVPVEVMVELANQIGADPWFNLPFHADAEYVRNFALYVRDNLDPVLVAYFELSNEVWNFGFQQAKDAESAAEAEFGVTGQAGWVNYYGKRASEVMAMVSDVFAGQMDRVVRVAGIQTAWHGLTLEILEAPLWEASDPVNYVPPHTYFDAIAGTTYFGYSTLTNSAHLDALLAVLDDASIDDYAWHASLLRGDIPDLQDGKTIPAVAADLRAQKSHAERFGLRLILYEGGQHVHQSFGISVPDSDALQAHLRGFVRSVEMATLYQDLWLEWETVGDGPFMHFVDVSEPAIFGSWGLYASLADSNPRADVLVNRNQTTQAWWETRGGEHFQQGRIVVGSTANEQLSGTNQEDFLIGGLGDDIIYPGPGDDGTNGGPGIDTVLLTGSSSQYTVQPSGDGFLVDGPDGRDYLYAVENINFGDGTVQVLDPEMGRPQAPQSLSVQ